MAAAGLGADSPSPRTLPLLAASPAFEEEEKDNYVADDEDEVDNTFDYIPPVNELSESSEDFGGDDERKEADEDQEQSVERAQLETDGSVTMETSVERRLSFKTQLSSRSMHRLRVKETQLMILRCSSPKSLWPAV
ncbi:hypothetical protein PI124_g7602 [Phytophthora idaei]|nr:hypothetical protein PI125_g7303 [Phytophthora idaei]KAG3160522.1 hypothetical protein PI126_g6864 [Phytophthora idaei]KAG3247710.1 hypothetical protein PI124_g7602 [Phytophthora idaei]